MVSTSSTSGGLSLSKPRWVELVEARWVELVETGGAVVGGLDKLDQRWVDLVETSGGLSVSKPGECVVIELDQREAAQRLGFLPAFE